MFQEYIDELVKFAAESPWQFLFTAGILMAPLFGMSAWLSLKLAKNIEAEKSKMAKIEKRLANKKKAKKVKDQ